MLYYITMNNQYIANDEYQGEEQKQEQEQSNKIYGQNDSFIFINVFLFLFLIQNLYFINDLRNLFKENIKKFLLMFNDEKNVVLDEDELKKDSENKEKENVAPKIYEEKYLEDVRKIPDEIKFTDLELEKELEQRVIIRRNMEDKLNGDKSQVEIHLAYLDKILNKLENGEDKILKKIKKTEDNDMEKQAEEEENNIEKEKEDDEMEEDEKEKQERKEQTIAYIQNEQKLYRKSQELLEAKKIEEEEINKLAREFILKERLDNLKNCIVMEKTPIGNVVMFYNNSKDSFEYYSDSTIPYRYLEVVGRKYVLTYNCKQIFVDMEQEIKEAEKKLEEKKKKEEEEKQKEEEEKQQEQKNLLSTANSTNPTKPTKPSKNVFAKFKNYNKDNSVKVAAVPLDRPTSVKQTKPQEEKIVKERANRYSFEGKLANFSFLKKIDRKVVDKRYAVSFSEFKKMQKKQ